VYQQLGRSVPLFKCRPNIPAMRFKRLAQIISVRSLIPAIFQSHSCPLQSVLLKV
jgi:hypothetical protein